MTIEQIREAAKSAHFVFKDSCSHTKDAIEYMEQFLLTQLAAAAPVAEQEPIGKVCVFRGTSDGDVFDIATTGEQRERIMQMDGMPIYAAPVAAAAPGAVQEPVGTVREYLYEGIARNGRRLEAVLFDGVSLPDGAMLYAAPVAAAAPGTVPPPELTWLFTHCRAIGMTCKSDSGKWEHDIALFTINMQNRIAELKAQLAAAAPVAIPAEIDVPKESELAEFLNWMAERLVHVYGENPNIDFVLACKRHATTLARGRFTRAGFDAGYDAGHIDAAAAATGEPI